MGCCWSKKDGVLLEDDVLRNIGQNVTTAQVENFEQPLKPVETSGGTAAFFSVLYREDKVPRGKTRGYWIGKDLAHASDELDFYEKAYRLRRIEKSKWPIFQFMFDYGGVAEMSCLTADGKVETRRQLLLRNILDETTKLRLIDIKIGAVTGVGGWQGKSHIHAMKNKVVDHTTNSHIEGFRAEGFDNSPEALETLLEADTTNKIPGRQGGKKLALQRLPACEFLTYFCLMDGDDGTADRYSGLEVAMLAVQQTVQKLITVLSTAAVMPIPQQWIGSSAALAFDTSARPRRDAKIPDHLGRVHLFDWGRSELTTEDMYKVLGAQQQKARASHWAEWVGGMLRLSFEVSRFYRRQYCPKKRWTRVRFKVWSHARNNDLQSTVSGTEIGVATVDLREASTYGVVKDLELQTGGFRRAMIMKTVGLTTNAVKQKMKMSPRNGNSKALLRVKIEPRQVVKNSCFEEMWVVHVIHASSLPKTDVVGWCNPVVTVCMVDDVGAEARLRTRIIRNTSDPLWNEKLYFGAAKEEFKKSKSLLPKCYHSRAPGDTIMEWDLAAGQHGDLKIGLRLFRDLYFHGDTQGLTSEERDELNDDILNKTMVATNETEQKLEVTQKLLEAEMRRTEALEDEIRKLKRSSCTPSQATTVPPTITPTTTPTTIQSTTRRVATGSLVSPKTPSGRGRAYITHPSSPSSAHSDNFTNTWPTYPLTPIGRGRGFAIPQSSSYVFST
eukprot:TRINITY_DN12974_c0_g1_i2.p1 TRINITY_DN12974_c0_g1~~TRINITY_DN12974_c0_g1_i2.p1  ORF type:complete len:726 (+),score=176.27 TRINITY_DN12974_c0_g1_i2:83-2260(+)